MKRRRPDRSSWPKMVDFSLYGVPAERLAEPDPAAENGQLFTRDGISIMVGRHTVWPRGLLVPDDFACNVAADLPLSQHHNPWKGDPILTTSQFPEYQRDEVYRFTSKEIWEKYLSKGTIKLGSLRHYRNIEDVVRRDAHEGHGAILVNGNGETLFLFDNALSGFNWLILCTTDLAGNDVTKFGDTLVRISNVQRFAEIVARHINARRGLTRKIVYSAHKIIKHNTMLTRDWFEGAVGMKGDDMIDPAQSLLFFGQPTPFRLVYDTMIWPGIFAKPPRFINESEVRLAFEMPADIVDHEVIVAIPELAPLMSVVT